MLSTFLTALIALFGICVLLKFAFSFVLPYSRRRAALDRAYAGRRSATARSDPVLLAFCILLFALLLESGYDARSFLAGLLIGATLIQLYFHKFSNPLHKQQEPAPPLSPIKLVSYAIQAEPWRPWPEMLCFAVLVVIALWRLLVKHPLF